LEANWHGAWGRRKKLGSWEAMKVKTKKLEAESK
jgi:hypothetical protein